jgi:hypothetical protein
MVNKNLITLRDNVADARPSEVKYAKIRVVEKKYGVGRWSLFALIRSGAVRSVLFKPSKKGRGYRLVDLQSLEHYLDKRATGGDAK